MIRFPIQSERRWLVTILFIALGLRIGFVIWLQGKLDATGQTYLIAGDAEGYWDLANDIVQGKPFAVHEPPRYVHRMPGFPALLAVPISIAGPSRFAARLFLATIGAACCWLVYGLGRRLHSPAAGLLAAALLAVSPASIAFSAVILSETAFTFAMLLMLLATARLIDMLDVDEQSRAPNLGTISFQALILGVAIALGVYLKPSWILAAPIVALLIALAALLPEIARRRFPWTSRFITAGVVMIGVCLALLPWGVRNLRVSNHFTLTTFWMGPSLYDGLNPDATGESDMRFFDQDQLPLVMSEFEVDREYRDRAIEFVKSNPRRVIELAVIKFWRYWKPWPNAAQFDKWPVRFALLLYTLPVFFLAIVGACKLRTDYWSLAILAGPVFYFCALHMVFVSSLRYRLPGEAPLMVLSAVGVIAIYQNCFRETEIRKNS